MAIEHEAKILDIDPDVMERLILDLDGDPRPERKMRRFVYDIDPTDQSKWIRLRDDGTEVTLTTKQILHSGIDGVIEHEVTVDDFDATNQLLASLGYVPKAFQESYRRSFILDGTAIEIDTWPLIPPYMEIEGQSKVEVIRIAKLLGFTDDDLTTMNTTAVYAQYGIDLTTITDLRFED